MPLWTLDKLWEISASCSSRTEFARDSQSAYKFILGNEEIMNKICSHMKTIWTHGLVQEEALKYKTRNEFALGSQSAYKYASINKLLDKICSHMPYPKNATTCTLKIAQEEALKYKTRTKFSKGSPTAYKYCVRRKLLDKVCSHMDKVIRWTHELVQQEALKYKTRTEFEKGSSGAHGYANRNKLLDKICSHMKKRGKK